jgi:RHS repeat-associated protein
VLRSLLTAMTGSGSGRRRAWRRRTAIRVMMLSSVFAIAASVAAAVPTTVPAVAAVTPTPLAVPRPAPVPVSVVHGTPAKVPAMASWQRPATTWPSPGSATVAVPAASAVQAGSLPVWTNAIAGASAPASVQVTMAPQATASAAGVHGVVFAVGPVGGTTGTVHVSLNYSSFAYAYGGDYASRLRLVELPACAMTTPQSPACQTETPLASADNVRTGTVGADVTLASPAEAVLAVTSTTSGSSGDYTATPLSEAGSWSAGGQSGAFSYTYPISVPPVPGGLEPDVSLVYNSQTVDGLTSSTNSQASWIGDGWDYSPGYIERTYTPCLQNSTASEQTGDFCWSPYNTTTLSLAGQATTLVQDSTSGDWHPENDNGEKVSYQTSGPTTSNGTYDNGYWVITQTNGDKYYFGLNELPGYASGDQATNSTWTMPVYQTNSGKACYQSTFADSHCVMAWRWNLDYVTDAHGDAIAYFYNDQTNYYASGDTVTATGTKANAAYQQGGELATIEYGLRAGAVYGHTPAAEVSFTTAADRTDVPTDLTCANGATCTVISPTFWFKDRLTTITTKALEGTSLTYVDSWALAQSYPGTGDPTSPPSLWLDSITRTNQNGSPALPPVQFAGSPMPNRVETTADQQSGYSIITRLRLTSMTNETGGVVTISYIAPGGACTSGNFPAEDANTLPCYPDWWAPSGTNILDWFNKYAVGSITQEDITGAGPEVVTSYSYSGAAWHYDDDALSRSKQRTWDEWRGYRTVTTETGAAPDPVTKTVDTYLQGMDGDYQSNGTTSSVTVTSSRGDTVTDSDQYAGLDLESIVYDGTSGGEVTDTVTLPWSSAATATQTQPSPLPALKSFLTGAVQTKLYTALAAGGDRESDTTYTHDSYGRVTSESSVPDTSDASEDTCTTTTYATNTTPWILDLPTEVDVVSVPCGTTATLPADAVSDTLTFYDGATSLSSDSPSAGNVTQTQLATSYSGSTPVYTTQSKATYDEYGRMLTSADADGRTTTTSYVPATGAEPTQEVVTDPAGLITTTTYNPARDLPLTVTNPAGLVTTEQYDSLGRLTAVWDPGIPTTGPANQTFSYNVNNDTTNGVVNSPSNTTWSYITSKTLAPDGSSSLSSVQIYDSLGRLRETQQEMPAGGWDVTDTIYNTLGNQTLTSGPYYATVTPGTLVGAAEDLVSSQDGKVYDGDGRVIKDISYNAAAETWETDTAYGGDYTTTSYTCTSAVPKCGGTAQTTFTDGRGLSTAIYQYHSGVAADPSDPSSDYDKTTYTYTAAQKLATITDAAGNKWSYGYDLLGDQTSQSDPDAGASTSTYDAAGQLTSVTDARGKTTSYAYDADGRKTAEYDTTGGALESSSNMLASWTYDTLAKGELTSSSSYYDGEAYTEAVSSYNAFGEPNETYTTIPKAQGSLAGNYITQDTYTPTGQLATYEDSGAGGLPTETVQYSYNTAGQPTSLNGTWAYVDSLSYTEYGQPQQYTMGSSSEPAHVLDSYDPQTQRLTEQQTETGVTSTVNGVVVAPTVVDDVNYGYDNVGDVLWENDTPSGGPAQAQCFGYDYLGRLTQAWSQGSDCTSTSTPSTSAESGAAAPYWDQYGYNTIGNLTSQTSTATTGQVTTTSGMYPATGSAQPHAPVTTAITSGSGTTTSSYTYTASGGLTSVTTGSQTETLSWDDPGRLSSITTTPASGTASTTSYLYDADGTLLLEEDPGQTTLYLSDEQIVLNTGSGTQSGALSGTRYYTLAGATVASRTSSGTIDYLAGDQQGTSTLAIDSSNLSVTRRYYDPYGNTIGTPASSWPGTKGFVGGTADPSTGLTNLGAREYNPGNGEFISPDSILSTYDPQDLNPYAYASGNPSTFSDPSGDNNIPIGGAGGGGPPPGDWCPGASWCPGSGGGGNPGNGNPGNGSPGNGNPGDWCPGGPSCGGGGPGWCNGGPACGGAFLEPAIKPKPDTHVVKHNTTSTGIPGWLACLSQTSAWHGVINSNCVPDALNAASGLQSLLALISDQNKSESTESDLRVLGGKALPIAGAGLDLWDHYNSDKSKQGDFYGALDAGVQTTVDEMVSIPTMAFTTAAGAAVANVPGGIAGFGAGAYLTTRGTSALDDQVNQYFNALPHVVNTVNNGLNSAATDVAGPAGPSLVNMALDIFG